jgi:site-specific recombinase XerD
LRGFFRYAVSRGHTTTVPLPTAVPKRPPVFVPYVYTREEVRRLLQTIKAYPRGYSNLEPATIRTMVLLYYGAGLRLREATNLNRADVSVSDSILTIRNTKFGKTRLVPLGRSLNQVLIHYNRSQPQGRPADSPFFTTTQGRRVNGRTVARNFRVACNRAGIRRTDTQEQPRVHDLRHTFAVHRLTSWYQQGADVQRLLQHLSVYLGHVHLQHTQVYLTMTPELLREASLRFERYTRRHGRHA